MASHPPYDQHNTAYPPPLIYPAHVIQYWQKRFNAWSMEWDRQLVIRSHISPCDSPSHEKPLPSYDSQLGNAAGLVESSRGGPLVLNDVPAGIMGASGSLQSLPTPKRFMGEQAGGPSVPTQAGLHNMHSGNSSTTRPTVAIPTISYPSPVTPIGPVALLTPLPTTQTNHPMTNAPTDDYASPAHRAAGITQAQVYRAAFGPGAEGRSYSPSPIMGAARPLTVPSNGQSAAAFNGGLASPAHSPRDGNQVSASGVLSSGVQGNSMRVLPDHSQPHMSTNVAPVTPIFVPYIPPNAEGNTSHSQASSSVLSLAAHVRGSASHILQRSVTPSADGTLFVQVSGPRGKRERLQQADTATAPLVDIENVLPEDAIPPQSKPSPGPPLTKRKRQEDASQGDESAPPRKKINNGTRKNAKSLRREATERAAASVVHQGLPQRALTAPSLPEFTPPVPQTMRDFLLRPPPDQYHP